jgi:rSAM/selenodomain-associated transferase 1
MVKAPLAGRVKTRLGRDIGMTNAAWWYRHQTARLLRQLCDPRWRIVLAVAKTPNQPDPSIWPKELQRVDQGTGDLGQRMKRLLAHFKMTPAVIIGSDIPQIKKHDIVETFKLLSKNQFVFGPSTDGGFWLVGAPRCASLPGSIFTNCRWSTEFALMDAKRSLSDRRYEDVVTLSDVDDVNDLLKLGFAMTTKNIRVSEPHE